MSGENIERLLGSILARLDHNSEEHSDIVKHLEKLDASVDSLRLWRASMLGASTLLGAIAGFLSAWIAR